MIKLLTNSFNFHEKALRRIKVNYMEKSASEETRDYLTKIKEEPGRTKLLALFLGAGEYYASNRNGDYFSEDDLLKSYHTFVEFGKVYRHHVNKDPAKSFGDIEFVCYNPRMHRVEGIMSLVNDKCTDILEKIDAGEDVPVSMACRVSFDECSKCHHQSRTFTEYCDHLKFEMNNIYPDGTKAYAINPNPVFFDISMVYRPADQTAYVLKKVAEHGFSNSSAYLGELYYNENGITKMSSAIEKKALIRKFSELEKEIEGVLAGKVENGEVKNIINRSCVPEMSEDVMGKLKSLPLSGVLSSLSDNDILLTIKEFLKLLGKDDMLEDVKELLPGSFSRLSEESDEDVDNFDFNLGSGQLPIFDIIKKLIPSRRIDDGFLGNALSIDFENKPEVNVRRLDNGFAISSKSGRGKIIIKKSNNFVADRLAKLYNLYKLAFCEKNKTKTAALVSVANNYK